MIGKVYLPINTGGATTEWAPPSDWQDISSTVTNEIKLLVADTNLTYAFKCSTSSGTYSINWGDGTTTSGIASNVQAQHTYTRGSGLACSRGYTTFVISIKSDTANITSFGVAKHTLLTVQQSHDILYANIKNASNLTTYVNMFNPTGVICSRLESLIMPTSWSSAATSCTNMLSYCSSLQSITLPSSWGTITNITYMFGNCYSLKSVLFPSSWGSVGAIREIFNQCYSLQEISFPSSWGSVGTALAAFYQCYNLQKITLPTTIGNFSTVSQMFLQNYALQYNSGLQYLGSTTQQCTFDSAFISTQNIDGVLSFGSLMSKFTFSGTSGNVTHCTGIRLTNAGSLFAGTSPQIDVAYNNMNAAAIAALFGDLPTLTGKTIRITGCTGAADTSNDSIATSKGWTINRAT